MRKFLVLALAGLLAGLLVQSSVEAGGRGNNNGPSVYVMQDGSVVTSVPAGTRFDICGKSFPANKLAVAGVAGYIPWDQVVADGAGAFCYTYTARSLGPGTYSVGAFYQKGNNWLTTSTTLLVW